MRLFILTLIMIGLSLKLTIVSFVMEHINTFKKENYFY